MILTGSAATGMDLANAAPYAHAGAAPAYRQRGTASKFMLLGGSVALIAAIAGNWQTPLFIFVVISIAWGVMLLLDRFVTSEVPRKRIAGACVAVVMLGLIAANVSGVLGTLTGMPDSLHGQLPILLGLTFYGLQVAGVASDLLSRQISRPRYLDYLVFILLGFKFYSGPIERAIDLDKIVNRVTPLTADEIWEAFSWTLLGIFMKFVIANPLAELLDLNTSDPMATFWVATVAELRIYFDFAGYSFVAFGLAKLAGIELTNNFRQPLYAPNIRDFWHRWHASFGNWLRQYIFFPVRQAFRDRQLPTRLLAPAVFLVSAFWHGATLSFAIWGMVHATAFLLFVSVLSKYRWPPLVAHSSVILLLIFVRLLYIDSDSDRLLGKLADFLDPHAWATGFTSLMALRPGMILHRPEFSVVLGLLFIALEGLSSRIYGTIDYRLFRTVPSMAVILVLTLLLIYTSPLAIFVYARN